MNKRLLIGIVIIVAVIVGIKMFTTTVENVATDTTKEVLNKVVKADLKPVAEAIKNQQLCKPGATTELQALGHEGQPLARSMAYIALAQESYLQDDKQKAAIELQQSLDASGKKVSSQQRDELLNALGKGAAELAAKRKQNGFNIDCTPL